VAVASHAFFADAQWRHCADRASNTAMRWNRSAVREFGWRGRCRMFHATGLLMKIRAGFRIGYECAQPTPMLLCLNIHPSRRGDLLSEQILEFSPPIEAWGYTDGFGNACSRIVAPPGLMEISTRFDVYDSGLPDPVPENAVQHAIQDLPDNVLVYLLGSRYCDTDKLSDFAWQQFSGIEPGWPLVKAITDFTHNHIAFDYMRADVLRTAHGGYVDKAGVCRDYAHLAITLCRCMNIPARYCTGYLGDIGVPKDPAPMDFSAWFEVYLSGRWHMRPTLLSQPTLGRLCCASSRS
jgi:transglutaminase-like putative cysteine protease